MNTCARTAILALLAGLAAAPAVHAGSHAMKHGGAMGHESMKPAGNAPLTDGTVRKVDPAAGKVTIAHGPMEHLGMSMGMTMVFRVKDAAVLAGVKPGDKIRFMAEKHDGAFMVTHIESMK